MNTRMGLAPSSLPVRLMIWYLKKLEINQTFFLTTQSCPRHQIMRMILEDLGRSTGEWERKTRQILQNFFGELDLDLIANLWACHATQHHEHKNNHYSAKITRFPPTCYIWTVFISYRFKPPPQGGPLDDPTPDYMNLLGMIFSMCGLMMKVSSLGKHTLCNQRLLNGINEMVVF